MVFVLPTIAHVESGRVLTLEISKNKKKTLEVHYSTARNLCEKACHQSVNEH